jgi:hypothetical protein
MGIISGLVATASGLVGQVSSLASGLLSGLPL